MGELALELGYIMHWVLEMTAEQAKDVVMNINERIPSLREEQLKFALSANSVEAFVNEYIIKGDGAFVGYKKEINDKNAQIAKENGHLFYFYKEYCLNRDLNIVTHNDFAKLLVEAAEKKGFQCKKTRRATGNYIAGVVLDPILFTAEYITGDVEEQLETPEAGFLEQGVSSAGNAGYFHTPSYPTTFVSPLPGEVHRSLTPNLTTDYFNLFK